MKVSAVKIASLATALPLCLLAASPAASKDVRAAKFQSVEVKGDAKVTLRKGRTQRVRILKGDPQVSSFKVLGSGRDLSRNSRMVINTCATECPPDYQLEVEITSPDARMLQPGAATGAVSAP